MAATQSPPRLDEAAAIDQPRFYDQDPRVVHAVFERLREESPVHWYEPGGFWVISKHADIQAIGRDAERFSTESGVILGHNIAPEKTADQLPEWAREPLAADGLTRAQQRHLVARANLSLGDPRIENLMLSDPPRHGELRRIFTRALSPRLIKEITATTERVAADVIGSYEDGSTVNWMEDVAERIPADVVAHIIDVPLGRDREQFIEWGQAFFATADLTPDADPAQVQRLRSSTASFLGYLGELVAQRRKAPGDDLVSRVIASELDGQPLTDGMAMMFIGILFIGGGGSARHLVCRMPHAFCEHPDQRALLLADRELLAASVEEVLRFYPITWSTCRTATEAVELRGQRIEAGDYVAMLFPSGNRDADVWERPQEFDIRRSHRPGIVSFGWGQHMCAGNLLARMTARVTFAALLDRFPGFALAGEPQRKVNLNKNMLSDLPIRLAA